MKYLPATWRSPRSASRGAKTVRAEPAAEGAVMIAVIFEVVPAPERGRNTRPRGAAAARAEKLPVLCRSSASQPSDDTRFCRFLSGATRTRKALANLEASRGSGAGAAARLRAVRLRVAGVIRDYGMNERKEARRTAARRTPRSLRRRAQPPEPASRSARVVDVFQAA